MLEQSDVKRFTRQLAAMIDRAGQDDPEAFAVIARLLERAAGQGLRQAADELRTQDGPAGGYSWADIAGPLGMNKQSAWERFRARGDRVEVDGRGIVQVCWNCAGTGVQPGADDSVACVACKGFGR